MSHGLPHASSMPSYFKGQVIFLVYDSRSGSTLFSRELAGSFPTLIATPEFRLNALFQLDENWLKASNGHAIAKRLFSNRALDNLNLDEIKFAHCLDVLDQVLTTESVLRCLLGLYAHQYQRGDAEAFVIKKGTHLPIWRLISSRVTDARYLHIYRDPRAVISSKLLTRRPYYPRESMAWGGALLAAIRWQNYSRQMRAAEENYPVLNIAYEALLCDPEKELSNVASFLSMQLDKKKRREYIVPDSEQQIHQRVQGTDFDESRTMAWRNELTSYHQMVIESVNSKEMLVRGYVPDLKSGFFKKSLFLLIGGVETAMRILIHFPYKWWADKSMWK